MSAAGNKDIIDKLIAMKDVTSMYRNQGGSSQEARLANLAKGRAVRAANLRRAKAAKADANVAANAAAAVAAPIVAAAQQVAPMPARMSRPRVGIPKPASMVRGPNAAVNKQRESDAINKALKAGIFDTSVSMPRTEALRRKRRHLPSVQFKENML